MSTHLLYFFLFFIFFYPSNAIKTKPNQKEFCSKLSNLFVNFYTEDQIFKIVDMAAPALATTKNINILASKLYIALKNQTELNQVFSLYYVYQNLKECEGDDDFDIIDAATKLLPTFSPIIKTLVDKMGNRMAKLKNKTLAVQLEAGFAAVNPFITHSLFQQSISKAAKLFDKLTWSCLTDNTESIFAFSKYDLSQ